MISRAQKMCLTALVIGDLLLGLASLWALPDRVPVHWNSLGQIDRYGSPSELALVFPIIVAAISGLFLTPLALGSLRVAVERSRATYGRLAIAVVGGLVGIHAVILLRAVGKPVDVLAAVLLILGVLLLVLGNWMGKVRRNGIVGIRTPWTLKSDVTWERTHRIGGRLQVVHAIAVLLATFLWSTWIALMVLIGGLLALVIWALVYSWWVDRRTAGDRRYA